MAVSYSSRAPFIASTLHLLLHNLLEIANPNVTLTAAVPQLATEPHCSSCTAAIRSCLPAWCVLQASLLLRLAALAKPTAVIVQQLLC